MKINQFIWNNYKETKSGQVIINLFKNSSYNSIQVLAKKYLPHNANKELANLNSSLSPEFPEILNFVQAELFFDRLIDNEICRKYFKGKQNYEFILDYIPLISLWLYSKYPDYFKPYFFRCKFYDFTRISDAFSFDLPDVPPKRNKRERVKYYFELCKLFSKFQNENNLKNEEFCAFLYDFAPKYVAGTESSSKKLPPPTKAWIVGGDKFGDDFSFIDSANINSTFFWQGNVDTKRGDIIIMYCLAPRSYIHSVWRAISDGIADPFFYFYGSIYIGHCIKIPPIHISELKTDEYFSKNPLVRRNLQGINGYSFSSRDYKRLLTLISARNFDTEKLPQIYRPEISFDFELKTERDVEINLIEPLLKELGYNSNDWIRQMPVRMGRGERYYPDYALLASVEKGYEKAKMLIESKLYIKTNKDLEETFKQARSYAVRLEASLLILCDKESIWIYEKEDGSFDRANYIKKFWGEINNPDNFNMIKLKIGKDRLMKI
ncbi:type I restriction enzyme HsdR N-terminal domain-containing protein [Anaerophaga thermohalophila]|jgi:hypothetical protein|uniref:type I restriction enzyme HsdR N-terminal domain-containing protein n=1 Tax=Anaerophaga thermohalophila TaxID=177400 RepID=UPI00031D6237|nr:type I restriction enzyme HsdR N-terminal domain-containing protein [Anaerophaga thermohalophila]